MHENQKSWNKKSPKADTKLRAEKKHSCLRKYVNQTYKIVCEMKSAVIKMSGGKVMTSLSEKELSSIKDSLSEEELLVKKYQMLAEHAETAELKEKMTSIADKHQGHFNQLYSKLS